MAKPSDADPELFWFRLTMALMIPILVVAGVGAILGLPEIGGPVTVHIVRTHVRVNVAPGGGVVTDRFGDGYYLDGSGRRHSVKVRGNGLRPGKVVQAYRQLGGGDVLETRSRWQGPIELALGVFFLALAAILAAFAFAFEIDARSSRVARDQVSDQPQAT